eukprot:TRINITY_DN14995_c0_g1_i1.p1 TRINITY_DN14995_c0_g1~~TRINITY_DN14995_c0_g1_i1.p1  ORF type:complete len:186 (+),score=56.79 TRINITY_DN14995_c0_g1_i1:90-647(+)
MDDRDFVVDDSTSSSIPKIPLNKHFLLLPLQIFLVVTFTTLILAQIVILLLGESECDKPLQEFIIVLLVIEMIFGAIGATFLMCNHFWGKSDDGTNIKLAYSSFKIFTNCFAFFFIIFFIVWICLGASWLGRTKNCKEEAEGLYNVSLASVILYFTISGIAFIGSCIYGIKKKRGPHYEQVHLED